MSDSITGSIKVGWSIRERDLGIDKIDGELTPNELRAMYDRIEEAVTGAMGGDYVDVYLDGKGKKPVRVYLDICAGMNDLEIDDGPVNGMLSDLRTELEEDDREGGKDNTGCDV